MRECVIVGVCVEQSRVVEVLSVCVCLCGRQHTNIFLEALYWERLNIQAHVIHLFYTEYTEQYMVQAAAEHSVEIQTTQMS